MKTPRFLTLTLTKRRSLDNIVDTIWRLRKELFRRLRDMGYRIDSWCGIVEFPNHIHIVIDSDYIPQHEISRIWHSITNDSFVVDIRRKENLQRNPSRAIGYLTKYLTKVMNFPGVNVDMLWGFHVVGSYGLPSMEHLKIACLNCLSIDFMKVSVLDFMAIPSQLTHPPPLNKVD